MPRKPNSIFPDENTIKLIAQTKQAEADALPAGPEKRKLQEEANSYRILAEAKNWLAGDWDIRPGTP